LSVGAFVFAATSYAFDISVPGGGAYACSSQWHDATHAPYIGVQLTSTAPSSMSANFGAGNANCAQYSGGWTGLSSGTSKPQNIYVNDVQGKPTHVMVGTSIFQGSLSVFGNWVP